MAKPFFAFTQQSLFPISVAERLKTYLFDQMKSVILTSATLAIGQSFDFLKERLR